MVRNLLFIICFQFVFVFAGTAQVRYLDPIFDSASVLPNEKYGQAVNYQGQTQDLFLDFYYGLNDTFTSRPLLILAHGGSFIQGNKASADIVKVAKEMAKRGYAVASIQYRLGVNIAGIGGLTQEFTHAVWRGTLDGRAAVRFFRKSFENGNPYGIDTSRIYVGGISAGGVLGLHMQCLDLPSEVAMAKVDTNAIGGIEGNSGNPGYSYRAKGVISLCGALSNVSWMENNKSLKLISMHGTNDQTVPYASDYFKFFGNPIGFLQGSYSVDSAAKIMGITSAFYTFYGADHVPFSTNAVYMDTTIKFVSHELYKQLTGLIPSSIQESNTSEISVYPNPASSSIQLNGFQSAVSYEIYSLDGKQIQKGISSPDLSISIDSINPGVYVLHLFSQNQSFTKRMVIE
ncbi:MAG: T9SS type A sorting domain-containing protein [Bacteroidia bacterium]